LLCTAEIAEVIPRETDRYDKKYLENMPNLKLRSRTHDWKQKNRNKIMKLLVFFLLQGLHQKLDMKSDFSWGKVMEIPVLLNLFSEWRFHLLLKFLRFVDEKGQHHEKSTTAKTVGWPVCCTVFNVTIWQPTSRGVKGNQGSTNG
jgi:hypothetical protein